MKSALGSYVSGVALYLIASAVVVVLIGCSDSPKEDLTTRMYVAQAYRGYFVSTNESRVYELHVTDLLPEMTWFTKSPESKAGQTSWRHFVNDIWPRMFRGGQNSGGIAYRLENGVWEMMPARFLGASLTSAGDGVLWTLRLLGTPPQASLSGVTVYLDDQGASGADTGGGTGLYLYGAAGARFEATDGAGRYRLVLSNGFSAVQHITTPPDFDSLPVLLDMFLSDTWPVSFASESPSAAVTIEAVDGRLHSLVASLSQPQWDAGTSTLSFMADLLSGNADGIEGPATVFIDSVAWHLPPPIPDGLDGWDGQEDNTIYRVVNNREEQYSIWPVHREIPLGWMGTNKIGTKQQCLDYIMEVWTDMRPLSLRK